MRDERLLSLSPPTCRCLWLWLDLTLADRLCEVTSSKFSGLMEMMLALLCCTATTSEFCSPDLAGPCGDLWDSCDPCGLPRVE